MGNQFRIPREVEYRLRRKFKTCAYCRCRMRAHLGVRGCPGDKATIEHLNRLGSAFWPHVPERHLVIVCGRCNSSRGEKRLTDWFTSTYCREKSINPRTVATRVRHYLKTPDAKR